jgi:hypothetical protein
MYGQQLTSFELHGDSDRFIFFAVIQWGLIRVVSMMSATNKKKCLRNRIEDRRLQYGFFT